MNHSALSMISELQIVGSCRQSYLTRLPVVASSLARCNSESSPEVLWAGFLGQPIMFPLKLRYRGIPIVLDALISVTETLVCDRKRLRPTSAATRTLLRIEQLCFKMSDVIITDTTSHARLISAIVGIPMEKFRIIPVGCDQTSRPHRKSPRAGNRFHVVYSCSFMPVHGVETVIRAARRVQESDKNVHFTVVGRGPLRQKALALARELNVSNCVFQDWQESSQFYETIDTADLCLGGHFNGDNPKSRSVMALKTVDALARGKPVIVSDVEGNREFLQHGVDAWMVPPSDPEALADGILNLRNDDSLRYRMGEEGYATHQRRFSTEALAPLYENTIEMALSSAARNH